MDLISIEVTAPGYAKWHLVMRFKNPGFMKFPVELKREDEGTGLELADSEGGCLKSRLPASSGILLPLRLQSPLIMKV
jgi:hypothetical protein